MTAINLESLGITRDELIERIVDKIVTRQLMTIKVEYLGADDDGEYDTESDFAINLQDRVKATIDAKIDELASRFVVPQIGELIENFTLQKTNAWGEKVGHPVTFIEYLVQRADAYLREEVDSDGRTAEECRNSGRSMYGKGTPRIAVMIDKYLHHHIKSAMESALANANSSIVAGLEATVKQKLAEVQAALKVQVVTR